MKYRWPVLAILLALALLLIASCGLAATRSTGQSLRGRMLLWHSLDQNQSAALNQVINSFTELNPNVTVKLQVFSTTAELNEQFINAATSGLGPDMILAPSSWLQSLHAAGLLAPIDDYLSPDVIARFEPGVLAMLQVNGESYGLPLSLDTVGLYVNRQLVESPSTSLAGLVEQANTGTTVLVPTNFTDAYWGIRAFGGQLFNQDGQAILDQGGFANWLAWLRDARNAPGMIQDTNRDLLRQRFMAGEAGYYIGYASELNEIINALGEENVSVLPLPNGPVGAAGPLVSSQAFLFGSNSSSNQRRLATSLATFITNSEQSSRLMRIVRLVPANVNVRINARLFPMVSAFASQARNGIPMPNSPQFAAAMPFGNEAYIRALEGGESPAEVAFAINNSINEAIGFARRTQPTYSCAGLGTIRLAHSWQHEDDLATLDAIINDFRAVCPHIIIETQHFTESELASQFSIAREGGVRSTFAIATQQQLAGLLNPDPQLKSLGSLIASDTLQRFSPIGIEAMRSQGTLYGLPFALEVDALYYNRQLVSTPAQSLDDLRSQAMSGIPIILDTRFEKAFWGIRAFGGQLFADNGASLLDQGGMADWLLWLRQSRDEYGIRLSDDGDEILRRFLAGESAYYVGGADELDFLQSALGDDLRIALLPSGPAGPAQPLVRAAGFVLRSDVTTALQDLALEFMRFATDVRSQTRLVNEADMIPANANVSTGRNPMIGILIEQAQSGFLLPNTPYWKPVVELGTVAYRGVLDNGQDPQEVVSELASAINRANGIVVTPTPTPTPATAEVLREEGEAQPTAEMQEGETQKEEAQDDGPQEDEESSDNGDATPSP
jgi:arabinogalactan oligomer/maltooligosaccharide transport system substrate-binding protein